MWASRPCWSLMYDVFYQADSGSSRFAGGLGLGLPIAQGLLNAMGGFTRSGR